VSAAFTGHRAGIMIQVRTMPVTRPSPALVPAGGHCHTVRQGARFKFATSAWLLLAGAFRRLLPETAPLAVCAAAHAAHDAGASASDL
jgi:hypothetical protein